MNSDMLLAQYLQRYQEKNPDASIWYSTLIDKKSARLLDCDFDLLEPQSWDEPLTHLLFQESQHILRLLARIDLGRISHAAIQRFFSYTPEGTQRLQQFHALQEGLTAVVNPNLLWMSRHPAQVPFKYLPYIYDWKVIIPGLRQLFLQQEQVNEPIKEAIRDGLLKTRKSLTITQFMHLSILLAVLHPLLGSELGPSYLQNVKIQDKRRPSVLLGTMIQHQKKVPSLLKAYMPFFEPSSFTIDTFFRDMGALHHNRVNHHELSDNELFF